MSSETIMSTAIGPQLQRADTVNWAAADISDVAEQKSRRMAVVTIKDTGKGISERDLGKIFIPFYTNKKKNLHIDGFTYNQWFNKNQILVYQSEK